MSFDTKAARRKLIERINKAKAYRNDYLERMKINEKI